MHAQTCLGVLKTLLQRIQKGYRGGGESVPIVDAASRRVHGSHF